MAVWNEEKYMLVQGNIRHVMDYIDVHDWRKMVSID